LTRLKADDSLRRIDERPIEFFDRFSENRMNELWSDLHQRLQHKFTIVKFWMRNSQVIEINDLLTVKKDIEIDLTLVPSLTVPATKLTLHLPQFCKQFFRPEIGLQHDDRIQEVCLIEMPDRTGLIDRALLEHRRERIKFEQSMLHPIESRFDVRTDADINLNHETSSLLSRQNRSDHR
jgi:hypothetical protein